jgi:signal transduction histidine kinase
MDLDLFEILEAQVSLALENLSLLQDRELRILEEQRLSKMVIIGDIGTGVAHQMNNRFNSMIEAVQIHFGCYGKEMPDLKSLSRDDLEARYADAFSITKVVDIESHNGFKIAEAMLASAREPIGPQPFKIGYTLRLALDLLKAKKNLKRINIIEDISLDSPCVWASTACIQDVLYNLVDNAADADEDKINAIASGKLKPEENKYEPMVIIRAHVAEGNLFLVEVEDNGIGIEEKHVESVGQPCYSTKAWKKMGTGYGVATVKKLLAQSGSKLEIRSVYGKGSVFSFALPLATKAQIEEHEKQKQEKD